MRPLFFAIFCVIFLSGYNKAIDLNFDIIPKEMLCTMCHTVISKFQDKLQMDTEKFRAVYILLY
jgi:hypothetical protein